MPREGAIETARGWIRIAQRDLAAGRTLLDHDHVATALFHCQQAVEKSLTSVMIARGELPPFVHSIELLATRVGRHDIPAELVDSIDTLMSAYTELRYDPTAPPPSRSDAELGWSAAETILSWATSIVDDA